MSEPEEGEVNDDDLSSVDGDFLNGLKHASPASTPSPAAIAAGVRRDKQKGKPKNTTVPVRLPPARVSLSSPQRIPGSSRGGHPSEERTRAPGAGGEDEDEAEHDRQLQRHRDSGRDGASGDDNSLKVWADEDRTAGYEGGNWNWRTLEARCAFRAGLHASQGTQTTTTPLLEKASAVAYGAFFKLYKLGEKFPSVVYDKNLDPPGKLSIERRASKGLVWKRYRGMVTEIKNIILPFLKKCAAVCFYQGCLDVVTNVLS
jgi:hypothetical protein